MEANQVAVQNSKKDLIPDRQDAVDLAAGERGVQEEAELDVLLGRANLLAEHGRQEHQVVIVDPDEIVVLHVCGNSLGEEAVGLGVCIPGRLVEGDLTRVVMEKRP